MKVLKDNYSAKVQPEKRDKPMKTVCDSCKSELEFTLDDVHHGEYGCAYVTCPLCGCEVVLENEDLDINLTCENLEWPTHFHHINAECGAKDVCDAPTVRAQVASYVEYLRENPSADYVGGWITGNLFVIVTREDASEPDNYIVYVSNDFYESALRVE